jgi:DNA-directed RNA polymerase III subunit RPC3
MHQRLVRHGLAVLVRQNLLFHHTDSESGVTFYEADAAAGYNLVRTGKILESVQSNYGAGAKSIVHDILVHGHMTVAEIARSYKKGHPKPKSLANGHANGASSELSGTAEDEEIDPADEAIETIARLVAIGILEPLNQRMFQSPEDLRAEVEKECMADYPTGLRGSKAKSDFIQKTNTLRREILDRSKILKRQLERDYLCGPRPKRRKLGSHGASEYAANYVDGLEVCLDSYWH